MHSAAANRITLSVVQAHPLIDAFIRQADAILRDKGFNEHGYEHARWVAESSGTILQRLGFSERVVELGRIAGYTHDVGNAISRANHAQTGALLVTTVLHDLGMDPAEIAIVAGAIGHHEESGGGPIDAVSAALIIADKTHIHRGRARGSDVAQMDVHNRAHYAVTEAVLDVGERLIDYRIMLRTEICSIAEFFELFIGAMRLCSTTAGFLGRDFAIHANDVRLM